MAAHWEAHNEELRAENEALTGKRAHALAQLQRASELWQEASAAREAEQAASTAQVAALKADVAEALGYRRCRPWPMQRDTHIHALLTCSLLPLQQVHCAPYGSLRALT
jgi:hypothetical protein